MTDHENPLFNHNSLAYEMVIALKRTIIFLEKPEIFWISEDLEKSYKAYPLEQEKEIVDITRLGDVPSHQISELFPKWTILTLHAPDEEGVIDVDQYYFDTSNRMSPIKKESQTQKVIHESSIDLEAALDQLRVQAENKNWETIPEIDQLESYDLVRALLELEPYTHLAMEEFSIRRDLMTDEEKLQQRARKYRYVVNPETDKTNPSQWWIVDNGMGLVYSVRSNSPDLALAIVDMYFEDNYGFGLKIFYIQPMEDEYTDQFEENFADLLNEPIRIIPFSRVVWPEDMNNPTPEQSQALKVLEDFQKDMDSDAN